MSVSYPKRTDKTLYRNLVRQCELFDVTFLQAIPSAEQLGQYGFVVDALFGFSFRPPIRQPFDALLDALRKSGTPICSIDVPSGWPVDGLDVTAAHKNSFIQPDCLVSLTAPKIAAKSFTGRDHWLGGRFVPPALEKKYTLNLPAYPATDLVVRL